MTDLHMHSNYSDGKNTISEMVSTAKLIGIKQIAITDHIWRSSHWFQEYCNEISKLKKEFNVLIGFEAKALSIKGEIDASEFMIKHAEIRLAALHRIPSGNQLNDFLTSEEVENNKKLAYLNWLTCTNNLILNENVDIIAHPLMVLHKYKIPIVISDIIYLMNLAQKNGKKFELSFRYKPANLTILDILKKEPRYINSISFGSDAHSTSELIKAHQ